jgi:hypothetical protein
MCSSSDRRWSCLRRCEPAGESEVKRSASFRDGRSRPDDGGASLPGVAKRRMAGPAGPAGTTPIQPAPGTDPDRLRIDGRVHIWRDPAARHESAVFRNERLRHQVARGHGLQLADALDQLDVEVQAGLADGHHHRRVALEVAHLLRVRLAEEQDGAAVPDEPDGQDVRPTIRADGAQPDDLLAPKGARDRSAWSVQRVAPPRSLRFSRSCRQRPRQHFPAARRAGAAESCHPERSSVRRPGHRGT